MASTRADRSQPNRATGAVEPTLEALRDYYRRRGADLAGCRRDCLGVASDPTLNALPRCLILEPRGSSTDNGVIVIGINPAPATTDEVELIRRLFIDAPDIRRAYDEYFDWLSAAIQRIPFYTLMRAAVTAMGFDGPILWTELVKCQKGPEVEDPNTHQLVAFKLDDPFKTSTVATCVESHLRVELATAPAAWPIVAAALNVGDYLNSIKGSLTPSRPIIAVPHPTGSKGDFLEVFTPTKMATSVDVLARINDALTTGGYGRISSTAPKRLRQKRATT